MFRVANTKLCRLVKTNRDNLTLRFYFKRKAIVVSGIDLAKTIKDNLKVEIQKWIEQGHRRPCLMAVIVGEDPASVLYINKKMEASIEVGIKSERVALPGTSTESEIISKIKELNNDSEVDGILVQLPLPKGVNEQNVCDAVDTNKDVDGFHVLNVGRLALNKRSFVPCTALAVIELIRWYCKETGFKTKGSNVVICSRSKNIGVPIFNMLHSDSNGYDVPGFDATVTLCHRYTPPEQLEVFTKTADIIVTAAGVQGLIKKDMVKRGAFVIDVATIRIETPEGKTKLVGDVDVDVREVAGYVTPVPGGVGPVTVAMLMCNTFKAAKQLA